MRFSWADSRARLWSFSDVSETTSVWRWRQSYFPKRRENFTSWGGCLPEKISLNVCANNERFQRVQSLTFYIESGSFLPGYVASSLGKHFQTFREKVLVSSWTVEMAFFLGIPTLKMRPIRCVETMGIDDLVTRRLIPPERETSAIGCKNLNSGLLRWMLAWGLVDRATVGAEDGQGSCEHKILEYLRPSEIQYSLLAAHYFRTVNPSVHYVCLLAVQGKTWA
jgi:hypothetical protein